MKRIITLLLLICALGVQAQLKLEDLSGKKDFELLHRIELNIVSLVPTVKEYKVFGEKVKKLPEEYVRYIDSIDWSVFNKKHSVIQIYSQDRVNQSKNLYEIAKNPGNDSLVVKKVRLDMKRNDYIMDYDEYMNQKNEYRIIRKKVKGDIKMNRIIFARIPKKQ
ncbi:MAG: hypothetical protein JNL03_02240 [Prolixibacteraceae bacterium]|nr:hypothetical protein [Prolixibacteraceae bacterium]